MKQYNIKYGKKFKQRSDEAFNAGKEIEASSLHCFNAFVAQLCLTITSPLFKGMGEVFQTVARSS
jgi:hypothetical protein